MRARIPLLALILLFALTGTASAHHRDNGQDAAIADLQARVAADRGQLLGNLHLF